LRVPFADLLTGFFATGVFIGGVLVPAPGFASSRPITLLLKP
jgi:hypothetical protein